MSPDRLHEQEDRTVPIYESVKSMVTVWAPARPDPVADRPKSQALGSVDLIQMKAIYFDDETLGAQVRGG